MIIFLERLAITRPGAPKMTYRMASQGSGVDSLLRDMRSIIEGVSIMKEIDSNMSKTEKLINILVIFIGVAMVAVGVALMFSEHEILATVFISVGSSLLASSVIMYLTSVYLNKHTTGQRLSEYWGLEEIYLQRSEITLDRECILSSAKKSLDMCAFGSHSMRNSPNIDKIVKDRVRLGLKIRMLVINPNSEYLKQRESEEGVAEGSIRKHIISLLSWVVKLKRIAPVTSHVSIKLYDALPLDYYQRVDDYLFIGPYQFKKPSRNTITLKYKAHTKGFEYYATCFDDLWDDPNFAELQSDEMLKKWK